MGMIAGQGKFEVHVIHKVLVTQIHTITITTRAAGF